MPIGWSAHETRTRTDSSRLGERLVFPRPAIAERTTAHVVIEHRGRRIVDSPRTVRTLETSHPPSYYIPPQDVELGVLRRAEGSSFCESKGAAVYWDAVIDGTVLKGVGWSYPSPTSSFAILKNHIAFYARPFDSCFVDAQRVTPQAGAFYGGWITDRFAGPFKGGAGSAGW